MDAGKWIWVPADLEDSPPSTWSYAVDVADGIFRMPQIDAIKIATSVRRFNPVPMCKYGMLVVWQRSSRANYTVREVVPEASVNVTGTFESNNSLAIRECLLKGLGIALIPAFVVQEDIQAGRLETVLPGYFGFKRNVYAVIPDRKHINSKSRAFIDFLKEKG